MQYVFGSYVLDTVTKVLTFCGERIVIQPKTLEVLGLLLRRANSVVTRREVFDLAWGGADLDENNLTQQVFTARKILERYTPGSVHIVTHAGLGYSFVGDVRCLAERSSVSTELPWQQVLCGHYNFDKRTKESIFKALRHFETALAIDAEYAPAIVGKAEVHAFLAQHLLVEPHDNFTLARRFARSALSSDPNLGNAWAVLGQIALLSNWDRNTAWACLERAFLAAPFSPEVGINRALYHVAVGRPEPARSELESLLRQEPTSLKLLTMFGVVMLYANCIDSAIDHLENVLSMEPRYELAACFLAEALAVAGKYGLALATSERLLDSSYAQRAIAVRGYCMGRTGDLPGCLRSLESMHEIAKIGVTSSFGPAQVYVAMGKPHRAIDALRQGLARRDPSLAFLSVNPIFESLRHSEGFKDIVRRVSVGSPKESYDVDWSMAVTA